MVVNGLGGWRRDNHGKRNYVDEAYRNAKKQFPKLQGVKFECADILNFEPDCKSLIYCDPPYRGVTRYKDMFDHDNFYKWCRRMKKLGHIIFVSEYEMPNDFKVVYQKQQSSSLTQNTGAKKGIETLFTLY